MKLADDFFDMKNDPEQISVNEEVIDKLQKIHHSSMSEKSNSDGPVAWILVIPTTMQLMEAFLTQSISERALLKQTPIGASYDAVYLCSALVLPEHRGKGLARGLAADAVRTIQQDHPIKYLFYWSFSTEGEKLANAIARELNLPLRQR